MVSLKPSFYLKFCVTFLSVFILVSCASVQSDDPEALAEYKKLNDPKDKHSRYGDISDYKKEIAEKFVEEYPDDIRIVKGHVDELINSST